MQLPPALPLSDAKPANCFLSRKHLSSHTGGRQLANYGACPCGRPLVLRENSRHGHKHVVSAAAAATASRPKAASKKRKQVEPLLVVEGVSKSHDGQRILFEGLDFTVARGDRLALVGPNGAGKSSLFNLLSGIPAECAPAENVSRKLHMLNSAL